MISSFLCGQNHFELKKPVKWQIRAYDFSRLILTSKKCTIRQDVLYDTLAVTVMGRFLLYLYVQTTVSQLVISLNRDMSVFTAASLTLSQSLRNSVLRSYFKQNLKAERKVIEWNLDVDNLKLGSWGFWCNKVPLSYCMLHWHAQLFHSVINKYHGLEILQQLTMNILCISYSKHRN